jgi:hypothetical protein
MGEGESFAISLKIRAMGFARWSMHSQIQRRGRGIFVVNPSQKPQAPSGRHIPLMSLLNGALENWSVRATKMSRLRRWQI